MTTTEETRAIRAEFKAARDAGLRKRHEQRLKRWENVDSWMRRYERAKDQQYTDLGLDGKGL
jgi:hypothetical protein